MMIRWLTANFNGCTALLFKHLEGFHFDWITTNDKQTNTHKPSVLCFR